MHKTQLLTRIETQKAVVAVVGLGYVGLPLAMEFADAGFTVIGFDVSERVVALLNGGQSHIQDIAAAQVAGHVASGRFIATTDATRMRDADAISIAVPTPLGKTRDPDMTYVHAATQAVVAQAHPGLLIVLESTTYPGTTREVLLPALEAAGFTVGDDVFLAFSP
ncbi:MAG: UDP-N-acetyl-D-glucosamine dehydrogenase, partial [Gemmatimonadaceae bacterium]|nr:UDP-N-acetyl-D-glucosamine dehydrogenase [Gemmatimonadaceae bacterium]